ncbi:MAG TPA: sigma-54 dependent transcriptional regulator [Pyrinomonadaceae bacterium]|nr:sigma-54-dependent Fis family transcriptional regulator [Acidobacteriota bacterium]HMM78834.1 sigma-54 dependent transcriptional regulator [Pyrinomonadaceae bacterium]
MTGASAKILLVDDDDSLRRVLEFQLTGAGHIVVSESDGREALKQYSNEAFDCLITDWRMPKMTGSQVVQQATAINSEIPIIVITAFGDIDTAVDAMRGGAFDFITKPFNRQEILLTVEKALKYGNALAENRRLRRQVHEEFRLENVVGTSEKMLQVFDLVERVSKTNVTVLIEGESGTGKELIAKGIHSSGTRRDNPFVAINCAAIPETLIEAELFGYKKGAFTGAIGESKGKFEEASGGTLFLDEISSMPLQSQTRLLRVLQEQEVTRLGENTPRRIDVRIIAATNENLTELIKENAFREDLYYRLAVVPIVLPPLRERREDLPVLTEHFVARCASKYGIRSPKVSREVFKVFFEYAWMGNVRELENLIERMVVLSDGDTLALGDVPENVRNPSSTKNGLWFDLPSEPIDLEALEGEIIRTSLLQHGGNQSQTAKHLGISRSALIYRMQKYGFE